MPMNHREPLRAAAFSPDGEWIVTAGQDNTARIWNARTGQLRCPPLTHAHWVTVARFSHDGERVVTASSDRTARIWDARTGQPLMEPMRHEGPLDYLDLSSDGKWLVTASRATNIVRLWDARTGQPQGDPILHRSSIVKLVCFSPDGRRLLSSDYEDDQVQLRDVPSGQLLGETPAREGEVEHGEFSSDGATPGHHEARQFQS
jgi:WD40 repeat protein